MCTLIVASQVWADLPLVVAANRDELLTRPSEGFARRSEAPLPFLAPRDLLSGGTWMGLNAAGLFVAITNRAGLLPDPSKRSRGLLVHDALAHQSADTAASHIAEVGAGSHNAFHLLMADQRSAFIVRDDGATVTHEELTPGFHVITERSFDAAPTHRPMRIREALRELDGQRYPGAAWFQELLSRPDHDAPMEGVCVRSPDGKYGTRSSTILELGARVRLLDRPTPPAEGDWVDLSQQAQALVSGS
jgi:hypothetical protein